MPLTPDALLQMVEQNHETAEEGHHRLRVDYRSLDLKVDGLDHDLSELRGKFINYAGGERSTDLNKLRASPRDVLAIVGICLSIAGGMWASTYGLRSDVRDIVTRMDATSKTLDSTSKLQDERASALKESIDSMKRRQELQQYEIQSLKDAILKGNRQ